MKLEQQEQLNQTIGQEALAAGFSGAVQVARHGQIIAGTAYGYANRAEERVNQLNTRFGIASGSKLFTAIAVCQLVDQGKLLFTSKVLEVLQELEFPLFNPEITVHQLLTHSSGIPDYFDEEVMEDFAALWKDTPMYTLRRLRDFLPLFAAQPMKFTPGERFHYNNAGYIMLGLLVEAVSGMNFTDYVEQHIFQPCGMKDSGYFALDALPANTAWGYIDSESGDHISNIYSIPVVGGADGGAFVTAADMQRLWAELLGHRLLQAGTTELLLTPHIREDEDDFYGYGVTISIQNGQVSKYHIMGYDPGVSFRSAVYPASGVTFTALCNQSGGAYRMMQVVEGCLLNQETFSK
jgi:CubicO group peptidase (beta-lactamase class C family)